MASQRIPWNRAAKYVRRRWRGFLSRQHLIRAVDFRQAIRVLLFDVGSLMLVCVGVILRRNPSENGIAELPIVNRDLTFKASFLYAFLIAGMSRINEGSRPRVWQASYRL